MSKALKSGLVASVRSAVRGMSRGGKPEEEDEQIRAAETEEDEDKAETEEGEETAGAAETDEDEDKAETDEEETARAAETEEDEDKAETDEEDKKTGKSAGTRSRTKAAFALMKSPDARGREKLAAELAEDVAEGRLTASRAASLLKASPKASRLSDTMSGRDVDPGADGGGSARPGSGLVAAVQRRFGQVSPGR